MKEKRYLQITSGRGPVECCRVVTLVTKRIIKQAQIKNVIVEILEQEIGTTSQTLLSATLSLEGNRSDELIEEWEGTIQWIASSPYRPYHKRKNWFIGIHSFRLSEEQEATESDIRYETLRASGPGGQHVNKTETAVRAIHLPTGMSVVASNQRSQWQNKKQATERLLLKLSTWVIEKTMAQAQENWAHHNQLERGNPVKTIVEPLI